MGTLQDLLNSGMSREEINALLSQSTVGTEGFQQDGYDYGPPMMPDAPPSDMLLPQQYRGESMASTPPRQFLSDLAKPQPPRFTVDPSDGLQRMTDRPGEAMQADMNTIRNNSTGVVTKMPSSGQRSHDVFADGAQVLHREQLADGTTRVTKRVPALDGFGRQSAKMVQEIEMPDYMNPAKTKELDYLKKQAEIDNLRSKPQVETPEQKRANEIIAAAERSKLPYTAEGARLAAQKAAEAKAAAGEEGKPLPISAAKGLMENQQNLRRAQEAQALLNGRNVGKAVGDKDATGWKGFAPDSLLQRFDAAGIDTRAAIADLGSLVIHDRSGAAVTAMEFPRLQPFIPSAKDDPATARKKLNRFVMEYQNIVDEATGFYKESGYKVPSEKLKNADIKRHANDGIPPMETWVEKAKELNPDMSGAEIEAEYMKKYRR